MQESTCKGLPFIFIHTHKLLEGCLKIVNVGYNWKVKNEGRRKRKVYFSVYALLQLSLFLTTCADDDEDHMKY